MPTMKLPEYVLPKTLKGGTAYYWNLPTWARKRDADERAKGKEGKPCPLTNERLPDDPARMLERAQELNASLDAWRRGDDLGAIRKGSFSWLVRWFQKHPKYLECAQKTRDGYDDGLRLIEAHELDDHQGTVGDLLAKAIEPYHADEIYERIRKGGKTGDRTATANAAMRAARRMYSLALRKKLVDINPFTKMDLPTTGGNTVPAQRSQVEAFVAAADRIGMPAIGTAAMIAFELCQREGDVIGHVDKDGRVHGIKWTDYRPGTEIQVRQHKTGALIWAALHDEAGELFPGLIARLDATPRRGPLIVMRDRPTRDGLYLPYDEHLLRKHVRLVRAAAALPATFTMMSCRHGGLTELGDAEATDQEMMAMGGHKTRAMLTVYSRRTRKQALNAARKRRALRTETAQESENS